MFDPRPGAGTAPTSVPLLLGVVILLITPGLSGCGASGTAGDDGPVGAGRSLIFSVRDAAGSGEGSCLSLAGAVTVHIAPGPDYGPFWRDGATGSIVIPSLSVPVGDLGTALVDVTILGYMAASPPPAGLPICSGNAPGLELSVGRATAATVEMSFTDNDGDGLLDVEEDCNLNGRMDTDAPHCRGGTLYETDPVQRDTDGGGIWDGDERDQLTDPLDPEDDLALFGLFPRVVYPGDPVVISGRGFSRNLYENEVRFGNTAARNLAVDENLRYLTVEVPDTVRPGVQGAREVTVERAGLVSSPLYCIPGGSLQATIPVGDAPHDVRFSPDGSRIYVINRGSRDLSVLDAALLEAMTGAGGAERIPLGEGPQAMDITADGTLLYVLNRLSEDVTPVDTLALAPAAANIPVGPDPWDILMIPGRDRAYVLNHGAFVDGCVHVLDTAEHGVVGEIDFVFYVVTSARGIDMGLNHDGSRVWVSNARDNSILKIDSATDRVRWDETVLNAGTQGLMLFQFSVDGEFAYVVGPGMAPPAGCALMSEIPTGEKLLYLEQAYPACLAPLPTEAVLSDRHARLFVASSQEVEDRRFGFVSSVDLDARSQQSIHWTFSATDLLLSPEQDRLYVADAVTDSLHVLNTASETSLSETWLGGDLRFQTGTSSPSQDDYLRQLHRHRVALSPDGSRLATANEGTDDVSVLAVAEPVPFRLGRVAATPSLLNEHGMCCDPRWVAFHPTLPRAYASSDGSTNLAVIDTRTHEVMDRIDFAPFVRPDAGDDPHAPGVRQVRVPPAGDAVFALVAMDPLASVSNPTRFFLFRIDAGEEAVARVLEADLGVPLNDAFFLSRGGEKIYLRSPSEGVTRVLDARSLEWLGQLAVAAEAVLFHPEDPGRGYMPRKGGVVLFDPRTDTLVDADGNAETTGSGLPVGISPIDTGTAEAPWQPRFSPDGKTLYAVDGEGARERVLVVDLERNELEASFLTRGRPNHVVPGPAGRKLYVMVGGAPEVLVHDSASFQLVHRIPVGNGVAHPVLSPDGSRLYLLADLALHAIDTASDQVVASVPVVGYGKAVYDLALSGDGTLAYVPFNPFITYPSDDEAGIDVVRVPAPLEPLPAP